MIDTVREDAWLRRNPPHPGGMIQVGCLDAVDDYPGMTISEAARKLGVSNESLSRVIHGRSAISIDLALKLEAVGWATADIWLKLQLSYDLAQARNRKGQWPVGNKGAERVAMLEAEAAKEAA